MKMYPLILTRPVTKSKIVRVNKPNVRYTGSLAKNGRLGSPLGLAQSKIR